MADLKLGSQIGGNLIWHQGILELNPVDDKLNYRDQEILTETGNQTLKGTMKFAVGSNQYDIESISNLPTGSKSLLRKFRGGLNDTIWHETVQAGTYRVSTGTTDSTLVMQLTNSAATFQGTVLTNAAQSSLANSLVRKDFLDSENGKKVNKSGDGMTGNLNFDLDNQGIRVKFPGGSVSNNTGVFGGKGDAAQKDKTNININSWYGVGFSPTVSKGTGNVKVVEDGENSIWFNLRSGNMYTVGRLFVDQDKQVYSPVNKPTPGDLNAYTKDEIDQRHWIRIKDERAEMIAPNALLTRSISGYFTNKSDVSTSWVSGFTVNGWESSYAAWSLFASSRSDTDDKRLWFKHGRSEWLPSSRIYHENDKPTNVELNLVSRTGDVMTGILDMKVPNSLGYGNYSIKMNNGSIGGLNQLVFNDPSDTTSEGIMFPKTGKNDSSTTNADYDTIWALDGVLKFNGQAAYGEWNKPNASDVGALKLEITDITVDLNTLGATASAGVYRQSANARATTANNYPIGLAGTLIVIPSAYGCQQEYTTFTGRKFQRGLTGAWNGNGPWGAWTEFYSDAAPTRYVKTTGDTITGTLKSTANIVIESTYDGMLTLNCTDDGPNYMTFARSGDNRFFIRQSTTGDKTKDRLELLSAIKIGESYIAPMWIDSTGVYTGLPQSNESSSLTRKDYVDQKVGTAVQSVTATGAVKSTGGINPVISLTNATNSVDGAMSSADKAKLDGLPAAAVNKAGDTMSGTLNGAKIKNSFTVNDKGSISFQDASGTRFHLLTEGNLFRIKHGSEGQNSIISLDQTGGLSTIGKVTASQFLANTDYGFVRSTDNSQGMFVGADGRTIIGGGTGTTDQAPVQIRPSGIGNMSNITSFNVDGTIVLGRQGTAPDHLINKAYVDAIDAKNVAKSGDTMTGNLNVKTEIFVKDNVNVTGHLILFDDKATGKTAGETGITTARMIEMLTTMGAFKTIYWCGKVNWNYSGNNVLTDTGYGNIHLAGCVVEVIGTVQYMVRITTPTTTGTSLPNAQTNANSQFIYVNHGSAYAPGWRRQLNDLENGFTSLGNITIRNNAPTVLFQDTDHLSAMAHTNSNNFYILRSAAANGTTWDAGPNGIHPMTLNLSNGDATFSRNGSFNDVQIRSDIRLKSNLIDIKNALDKVCSLTGKTFDKFGCDKREAGIIAQDLQKVLPEAVGSFKNTEGEEYLTVSNSGVNALLIEAIKELSERVKRLEAKGK